MACMAFGLMCLKGKRITFVMSLKYLNTMNIY